jgi:hypothetical protein
MKVYLSPQNVSDDKKIKYAFFGESVTAVYGNERDTFDFTGMPLGVLDSVETTLSVNPIIKAERTADGLYVTLLNYVGDDATQEENFPSWMEV